jgi:twitching motility two-component system response regulator PilH
LLDGARWQPDILTAACLLPVKRPTARTTKSEERILVLEPDESLLSSILSVLHEVAPEAVVDVAHDVDEAHRLASGEPVELFVFDLDIASDSQPDLLGDLRASHPTAEAIFLRAPHLSSPPEESRGMGDVHFLEKPFSDSDFRNLAQNLLRPGQDVRPAQRQRILVIDDSVMLLGFVEEILTDAKYDVVTAGTAEEGLQATRQQKPDLILLDYLLPDLRGDEVSRRLSEDEATAHIPVIFMSGFAADLGDAQARSENILGILHKPFTSDSLVKAVQGNLSREEGAEPAVRSEFTNVIGPENEKIPAVATSPLWNEPASVMFPESEQVHSGFGDSDFHAQPHPTLFESGALANTYFSGDTGFFSFSRALRVISHEKLTGTLRSLGTRENVDLHAREGKVVLVTTRDAETYCSEAPITLVNIDPDRVAAARETQSQTGCPLFITLLREDLILRDPALQLVQHYGQKLFARQWSASRVRFAFDQTSELPDFTNDIPAEDDIEHWMLSTLRFVQTEDVADKANYDPAWIPAYTRDGFERIQKLRLTVAEAQFASQFDGSRSLAQIARNLRLDLKFARLTLFRFVELEIVECWPPPASERAERGGVFKRLGRSIGIGE